MRRPTTAVRQHLLDSEPIPAWRWEFKDGAGTTISARNGGVPLTDSGGGVWSSAGISIDQSTGDNRFTSPNGTAYLIPGDFTVLLRITLNASTLNRDLFTIGSGASTAAAGYQLNIGVASGNGFYVAVSDGTNTSIAQQNTAITTSVSYFLAATYNRIGDATSLLNLRWTADGVTWRIANQVSNARLMANTSTFEVYSRRLVNVGANAIFQHVAIYNQVLSPDKIQYFYNKTLR